MKMKNLYSQMPFETLHLLMHACWEGTTYGQFLIYTRTTTPKQSSAFFVLCQQTPKLITHYNYSGSFYFGQNFTVHLWHQSTIWVEKTYTYAYTYTLSYQISKITQVFLQVNPPLVLVHKFTMKNFKLSYYSLSKVNLKCRYHQ